MAKITIIGDAVVITSSLKLEEIKTIEKYRPEALILKGGEDGKEPIFRVGTTQGVGTISKYGAEFDGATRDEAKLATITLVTEIDDDVDIREAIADTIGAWVMDLNKVEAGIPAVLEEVAAEKAAILANITVA